MPRLKLADLPGSRLAAKLKKAIGCHKKVLEPGARDLPILRGVTPFDYDEPQENVLDKALQILIDSKRVFVHDNNVVMEVTDHQTGTKKLIHLSIGIEVKREARFLLANLLVCECKGKQIPIPDWFMQQMLRSEKVLRSLPHIKTYAPRPVFDENYLLCSPDWHPDSEILVHGPEVEPFMEECNLTAENPVDRLPPRLRRLLQGFCFKSAADLANTVGMLLTGLLFNLFIVMQKALCMVDGNQPGLGKTLLVQVVGVILDGRQPRRIPYLANDEELEKKICADLRGNYRQSLLLIDNAKSNKGSVLSSSVIEANCTAPRVSFRILKSSNLLEQDNDFLWFMTMNNTRACQDIISRSCVIQLSFDGKPEKRHFDVLNPVSYALQNRLQILGELAGMVKRWDQKGRPLGQQQHRQHEWAGKIGGILGVAGFPEFLANADEAATSFSPELDQLGALAELAIRQATSGYSPEQPLNIPATPERTATDWVSSFESRNILFDEKDRNDSARSKAIKVGRFLSSLVDREGLFEINGRSGKATLRSKTKGSKGKVYFFDLVWDNDTSFAVGETTLPATPGVVIQPIHDQSTCHDAHSVLPPAAGAYEGGNNEAW